MNSNQYYDPDAMAQEYADKAHSNLSQGINETWTQGDKETAKLHHIPQRKKSYTNCSFIDFSEKMKPNKHEIAIEIMGEYIMLDVSPPYLDYKIQGFSERGEFETIKGIADFVKIREKLMKSWPGCKIPPLPRKSLFRDFYDGERYIRRTALGKFFKEIANFPFLFFCDDFQEFLKTGSSPSEEHAEFIMKQQSQPDSNMNMMPGLFQASQLPSRYNENKKNKHGIAIHIVGESCYENDSIIYIDYKIQGSSTEKGEFETAKGYLDFVLLRKSLVAGWPGCVIPSLPSPDLFCDYQDFNGNARRNGLLKFVKDVADFPFLFYSACFQEFLKSGPSSAKQQTDFIKQSLKMTKSSNVNNILPDVPKASEKIGGGGFVKNNQYEEKTIPKASHNSQRNTGQIKPVVPQNKKHPVTIIGEFQRAGSFRVLHKEYHIRGYDQNGMFEVNRRYSDFLLIREILLEKWPGFQFKELPPRIKTEGDSEEEFQKARSRGLIEFLHSITLLPVIFGTAEWQTFIKDPSPKIADKLKSFKKGLFSKIFGFGN